MQTTGRVIHLDELNFELADDAGRRHRFGLALDATMDAGPLAQLLRDGTRVVVDYEGDIPGVAIAQRVFVAESR